MVTRIKIFVCFASEDEKLFRGLKQQLGAIKRHRDIEWYSDETSAGTDWKAENEEHLKTAHIILLLVSPAFMASDYCYFVQVKQAMDRHKRGEAIVIPVILRPTNWQEAPFGELKALPTNMASITSNQRYTQDEAFFDVTKGILEAIRASNVRRNGTKNRREFSQSDILYPVTSHSKRPLGMQLCPFCIEEFYPSECDIRSMRDGIVIESGKRDWLGKRMKPISLTSPEYRELQACRECPHCRYLLPYNIEQVDDNISIAIIGDVATGKSVYLTSLLYLLKERWMKNNPSIQINSLNQEIEERYTHRYLLPLFEYREPLVLNSLAVSKIADPLIYTLNLRISPKKTEKKINLIFYDGAGEDYVRQANIKNEAQYVLRASAIIFVVDPQTIPEINNHLPEYLQGPEQWVSGASPAYHFLTSIIELLDEYYPSAFRSVPLAVMLSKSDLLKHIYGKIAPPLSYLSDFPHYYPNLQDIKNVDTEVRTLIGETRERPLLEVAQRFSKVGFFASSATGCSVDHNGYFPHVFPYRCLDPFLWVLHQLKVIPARRNSENKG